MEFKECFKVEPNQQVLSRYAFTSLIGTEKINIDFLKQNFNCVQLNFETRNKSSLRHEFEVISDAMKQTTNNMWFNAEMVADTLWGLEKSDFLGHAKNECYWLYWVLDMPIFIVGLYNTLIVAPKVEVE